MTNYTVSSYSKNIFPERVFSFQKVSRNKNASSDTASFAEWIGGNEIVSLQEQGFIEKSGISYHKISFRLAELAAVYYSLLKGIIALGKSGDFTIQSEDNSRSFVLQFEVSQEAGVRGYLDQILNLIKDEMRFKRVLRQVISNQEKFEREEKLLFTELSKQQ